MRCAILPAVVLAAVASASAFAGDALLFYASFDDSCVPDAAAGGKTMPFLTREKVSIAPGRVGNCLSIVPGAQLVYEGEGNAYAAAGTISFFWRPDADLRKDGFVVLDLSALETGDGSRLLRLIYDGETLELDGALGDRARLALPVESLKGKLRKGAWRHIAMAWDQARGAAVYVDGALAAEHQGAWYYDGNANQIGLGLETYPDRNPCAAEFAQSYDELRVYDRWLDEAALRALAQGQAPAVGEMNPAAFLALKRKVFGWENPLGVKPTVAISEGSKGLGLRQIGIAASKDLTRNCRLPFDGERGRSWPCGIGYHDAGRRLDFEIYPGQKPDVFQLFGSGPLTLRQAGAEKPVCEFAETSLGTFYGRAETPVSGEKFSIERPLKDGGRLYEMNLFETIAFDPQVAGGLGGWQRSRVTPTSADQPDQAKALIVRRTSYPPDQQLLMPTDLKTPGRLTFPAMRTVHVNCPFHRERQGLAAIALDLAVTATTEPNVLRVEVFDPINPERRAVTADIGLTGLKGRLNVMLNLRSLVFPPAARARIALTFRNDTEVDLARSTVRCRWLSVKEALPEYTQDQFARARDLFEEISEYHPWGCDPNALKSLRFLLNGLEDLHALAPADHSIQTYWRCVRSSDQSVPFAEGSPGVPIRLPPWAAFEDTTIEQLKKMPAWWIAHRQNSAGEFGSQGGIRADTALVSDWLALDLMRGPDPALFDSLKRVAENSWHNGLGESGPGDGGAAPRTYEDGVNAQCQMALMDYGNPVYMERLFACARSCQNLMTVDKAGQSHFKRSPWVRDEDGDVRAGIGLRGDSGSNALLLQPAMLAAWYSDNAACRKLVVDWTDGMMAQDMAGLAKGGRLGGAVVDPESGETSAVSPCFGCGFFDAPWACYELTGDTKYLDFIKLGIAQELSACRHTRQTGAVAGCYIRETGDVSSQDRFLAAIQDPALSKKSLHDDHYYDLDAFYFAWQCGGDLKCIADGIRLTYHEICWDLPMLTSGELCANSVWLPQRLVNRIVLGGPALLRDELYPKLALSWEDVTGHIGMLVRKQDRKQFQVWIINLDGVEHTINMRIWGLDHGRYELSEGSDMNLKGKFDGAIKQRKLELARHDVAPITLGSKSVTLVVCKQLEPLDDIRQRPDLAVCADDAVYDARSGALTVRVHNIGSKPSGPYVIRIRVGDKVALEKQAPSLDSPADDLMPKVAEFKVQVADPKESVTVELDPGRKILEITKANNSATFVPADLPPPWPIYSR